MKTLVIVSALLGALLYFLLGSPLEIFTIFLKETIVGVLVLAIVLILSILALVYGLQEDNDLVVALSVSAFLIAIIIAVALFGWKVAVVIVAFGLAFYFGQSKYAVPVLIGWALIAMLFSTIGIETSKDLEYFITRDVVTEEGEVIRTWGVSGDKLITQEKTEGGKIKSSGNNSYDFGSDLSYYADQVMNSHDKGVTYFDYINIGQKESDTTKQTTFLVVPGLQFSIYPDFTGIDKEIAKKIKIYIKIKRYGQSQAKNVLVRTQYFVSADTNVSIYFTGADNKVLPTLPISIAYEPEVADESPGLVTVAFKKLFNGSVTETTQTKRRY